MLQLADQIVLSLLGGIEEVFKNLTQEVRTSLLVFEAPFDYAFVGAVAHPQVAVFRVVAESVFTVFMQVPHSVEDKEARIPPE